MEDRPVFAAADYAVFASCLFLSLLIGVFYGIKQWRAKSGTEEYLLAGRKMTFLPVALSLAASYISAISMLGVPGEVYRYGTMIWWFYFANVLVVICVTQIYVPIYYKLRLTSTYEYMELRFNKWTRALVLTAFIVESLLYLGVNIYAPSLALNAVTQIDLNLLMLSMGIVCTIYTMLGGLKAVIWSDVFQSLVLISGLLAVLGKGSAVLGGFGEVWKIAERGGRVEFLNFEVDPRVRSTVWSAVIGGTIVWTNVFAISQSQVQRYISCKNEPHAKWALVTNTFIVLGVGTLACMTGLTMYAYYSSCDPLSQKCVDAGDQLLPYMVMDIFRDQRGLPGFFVAAVFSASLSTISSGINALATVTLEDFVKRLTSWNEKQYTTASKLIAVMYGAVVLGVAYLVSALGDILQLAVSITSLIGGPLVGIFTMGIVFPFVNSTGAISGFLLGLAFDIWWYAGSSRHPAAAHFRRPLLYNTSSCTTSCEPVTNSTSAYLSTTPLTSTIVNNTHTTYVEAQLSGIENFYSISYFYMGAMGLIVTLVSGIIVALLTNGWAQRKSVPRKLLLLPGNYWMFQCLPNRVLKCMSWGIDTKKNDGAESKANLEQVVPKLPQQDHQKEESQGYPNAGYNEI